MSRLTTLLWINLTVLLLSPLAALHANDAAWLQSGELLFHDAFEREETGNEMKAPGNGWESATADRVPDVKQADLDEGVPKIASVQRAEEGGTAAEAGAAEQHLKPLVFGTGIGRRLDDKVTSLLPHGPPEGRCFQAAERRRMPATAAKRQAVAGCPNRHAAG